LAYTLSASGRTLDRGETVAAQRFSQIRSPDAPPAFEKSRLEQRDAIIDGFGVGAANTFVTAVASMFSFAHRL
jgi:hypothetical protein